MTDLPIKDYIHAVETLARNKSQIPFRSTDPQRAAILMATILKFSKTDVRIYDGFLNGDIADQYPPFFKAVESFLKQGKTLKICLREITPNASNTYDEFLNFANEYPQNLEIKLANEVFRTNIKDVLKKDIYFTVGDNFSYRMETTERLTEERKAICCFFDESLTSKLVSAFEKNFAQCTPIKLPVLA